MSDTIRRAFMVTDLTEQEGIPEMSPAMQKEFRAYQMLRWVPHSMNADQEFDYDLAAEGFYSKQQLERSTKALHELEAANPRKLSEEMAAFMELERLGVISKNTLFSPSRANPDHAPRAQEGIPYTEELERVCGSKTAAKTARAAGLGKRKSRRGRSKSG